MAGTSEAAARGRVGRSESEGLGEMEERDGRLGVWEGRLRRLGEE